MTRSRATNTVEPLDDPERFLRTARKAKRTMSTVGESSSNASERQASPELPHLENQAPPVQTRPQAPVVTPAPIVIQAPTVTPTSPQLNQSPPHKIHTKFHHNLSSKQHLVPKLKIPLHQEGNHDTYHPFNNLGEHLFLITFNP